MKEILTILDEAIPNLQKEYLWDKYPKSWQQYVKSKQGSDSPTTHLEKKIETSIKRSQSLELERDKLRDKTRRMFDR